MKVVNSQWSVVSKCVFGVTLCASLLALCVSAQAQQTGKIFRIGYLDPSTPSGSAVFLEAFRQELRKLGWNEGKNFAFEYRFAEQKFERAPELMADLLRLKVDLIVVSGTAPASAAKSATSTVPIVMANVGDPVGVGLVASLARPGGNITGLSVFIARAEYQTTRDTEGRGPQARASWTSDTDRSQHSNRPPTGGAPKPAALALNLKLEEIETQADPQGLDNAFQTAKQKQAKSDYDDRFSAFFYREKADRRAYRQIPIAGYLYTKGVCR